MLELKSEAFIVGKIIVKKNTFLTEARTITLANIREFDEDELYVAMFKPCCLRFWTNHAELKGF